jgi:hypothetical protein
VRFEDVEGPLGDDPRSLDLFRHEPDPLDNRPTKADTDRDEWELRSMRLGYSDGGI